MGTNLNVPDNPLDSVEFLVLHQRMYNYYKDGTKERNVGVKRNVTIAGVVVEEIDPTDHVKKAFFRIGVSMCRPCDSFTVKEGINRAKYRAFHSRKPFESIEDSKLQSLGINKVGETIPTNYSKLIYMHSVLDKISREPKLYTLRIGEQDIDEETFKKMFGKFTRDKELEILRAQQEAVKKKYAEKFPDAIRKQKLLREAAALKRAAKEK